MKFINKKNKGFALKANIIVDAFIKGQRKKGKECKYFLFLNTPYKNKLQDVLIAEQQEKCCYCMRRLTHDNITIEHVIPKSAGEVVVNTYLKKKNVVFRQVKYEKNLKVFVYPPYPHLIAYGNLCVSCKGILKEGTESSFSCNCKRKDAMITPLIFMPDIKNKIEYMGISGEVRLRQPDSNNTLDKLGLNNETLKEIRFIWALTAKNRSRILIKRDRKYDFLFNIFHVRALKELRKLGLSAFEKYFVSPDDYYWKLLKEYDWFYYYFKKKK